MAKDVDDDYYYDEGTLNEQLDDFGVYEKDGQFHVHYKPNDNVVGFSELAALLGGERADPATDELDDGEVIIYVADSESAGTEDALVAARNVDGDIVVEDITDAFTA